MNDQVYHQLRESSWRRKLTGEEETQVRAWLATHPEDRADWETEAALNHLLEELPAAPAVSSNFTTLVVEAMERETSAARAPRRTWALEWRTYWLPRMAMAIVVLAACIVAYQGHVQNNRREMADSVAKVSGLYQVVASNPDAMEDFDAIRCLGKLQPKADTELLTLMQ
jgi:hypothetical protein